MLKLQSTIIYQPGALVRIKKTNSYGIVMSLFEEKFHSYTYNILPLNLSKWWIIRSIQLCLIKQFLNNDVQKEDYKSNRKYYF